MESTLERMVDRVYQEGISRAEERARQITAAAETKAEEITSKAREQAEEIIRHAKAEAEKLLKTAQSDLGLLATRALSQLKSEIGQLLSVKTVAQPVAEIASDPAFISAVVLRLLATEPGGSISLVVPEALRAQISSELSAKLQGNLQGLEIKTGANKTGFTIVRKDAGYELDFTETALMEFLQPYLKPAIAALFQDKHG